MPAISKFDHTAGSQLAIPPMVLRTLPIAVLTVSRLLDITDSIALTMSSDPFVDTPEAVDSKGMVDRDR
jgi:hypothetical protein